MFRCGVIVKTGEKIEPKNWDTKEECEDWILGLMDKYDLKKAIIVNKDNIKERWIETF